MPFRVVEFMHVKPGKGAAFVRTKIKNCLTGATQERTFRAAENVPDAVVTRREAQYTYAEGEEVRDDRGSGRERPVFFLHARRAQKPTPR